MNPFVSVLLLIAVGFACNQMKYHLDLSWDADTQLDREWHLVAAGALAFSIGVSVSMHIVTILM
jgi:hypothetical protein